jgi:putative methyltransferase (TIGR04325 family)
MLLKNIKQWLKIITPLPLRQYVGGIFYGYFGPYPDWESAQRRSSGYDAKQILEKVSDSLMQVKTGAAAYERDSVLFDRVEQSWPLLSCLLYVASCTDRELKLIDFGGSLGSSYFQNRSWLNALSTVSWAVVEQPNFVRRGRELFADRQLVFFDSIESASDTHSSTILLSSSIQYLAKPYDLIREIIDKKFRYIIIDRTGFTSEPDFVTLQKVPPQIYVASYPCWFFNESRFLELLSPYYNKLAEWPALGGHYDRHGISADFKGFLFERI